MNYSIYKRFVVLSLIIFSFVDAEDTDLKGSGTTGSIGTVTINGQVYNQLSLRPEVPIGKLGIGLDIYLYFNDNGMYWDSWNFSSGASTYRTIIDKLYYLRWGKPGDDLYIIGGALPSVTLGNGILVSNYSNILEYPQVRKVGLNIQAKLLGFGLEFICSNFKTVNPSLLAFRFSKEIIPNLSLGFSGAMDNNQLAGLPDTDGDSYPDYYDFYPEDSTKHDGIREAAGLWTSLDELGLLASNADFDLWFQNSAYYNEYNPESNPEDPVSGISIDATYNLNKKTSLYSQAAMLLGEVIDPETNKNTSLGFGGVPIGIRSKFGPINFVGELRIASRYFIFNYWDRAYDINRVSVHVSEISTKESLLREYGALNGFYCQVNTSFMDLFDFSIGYQNMNGEKWNVDKFVKGESNKGLISILSINSTKIPKVGKAEAFYQQNNVTNVFEFEPDLSTIYGYDLGLEMSSGVMLVYKARTNYMIDIEKDGDLKSVNSIQIETQFIF
jgi:hypothetical protein